jgi:probable rRNA maturation factor
MIAISNRQRARKLNVRLMEEIATAALVELKITETQFEIVLVGTKESAAINEKYLGHEGPTDVITFDYSEKRAEGQLHGEIFVCVPEADKQAKEFGTSWQSELVRYVVHGALHLTGYDDLEPAARKKMKREEERLLAVLSRRFALSKL